MGLLPDGDHHQARTETGAAVTSAPGQADFKLGEALRTVAFWVLTLAVCLRIAAGMGMIIHFVPIMVWKGTSEAEGAILLGALSLFSIPLRVFLGWASDRLPRTLISAAGCGVGAIALLLLHYAQAGWQLWLFVLLFAMPDAIITLNWAIIADFFGRKHYATIRGAMTAFTGVSAAVLPVVAGVIFDRTQSYELTIWLVLAVLALAAVVFAILRPPSVRPSSK